MTLVLSPHLDDAVFSCGGLLAALPDTTVATCFTASVEGPTGFALACQRDKHLPDNVDYMAVRREEDRLALAYLDVDLDWWDLPEAPHRGYRSAAELFAGIRDDDRVLDQLQVKLEEWIKRHEVTSVLYPYGAGNHVDHLQVIAAVRGLGNDAGVPCIQYVDQPYANKHRERYPEIDAAVLVTADELPTAPPGYYRVKIREVELRKKYRACSAYRTQVPFQFGDEAAMQSVLGSEEYYFVP